MKAKGRGKRGGYRVVYYFPLGDEVWLITIYDKVKQENLSAKETLRIANLIKEIQASR